MDPQSANRLIAAAFESPQAARHLVRAEPNLLESRTGLGETPLHYLAVEDQLEAVAVLVDAGATVNTVNNVGGTPLSEAASLGYEDLVEYLLSQGAKLRLPGQHEPTLHEAVRSSSSRVVQLVLAAGAELNEANDLKQTALHIAAEEDSRHEVLKLLISSGADLAARALFDETALDVATRTGANSCAAALTEANAPRGASAA